MRKMKRYASFALAACMAASLFAADPVTKVSAAEPDEVITSMDDGTTEEIVTLEATETDAEALDEKQEVVYDDRETDADGFVWEGTKLVGYKGNGGDVIIPEKCTDIGSWAFYECKTLTSVKIPSGVASIPYRAFEGCSGLISVEIPASVTTIEDFAFYGCSSLASIRIPSSVTTVGKYVFFNCMGLESIVVDPENVTYNSNGDCNAIIETGTNRLILGCKNTKIPSTVTSIGTDAFEGCSGLTSIEIPASLTTIESAAFEGCSGLTSIKIPQSVTYVGGHAFKECSGLVNVEFSAEAMSIRNLTFYGCSSLKSIKIPEGITEIAYEAFYGCSSLASIEIPASVTTIGDSVFNGCSGLESMVVNPENETYNSGADCNAIIETETGKLVRGCKNTKIPSSVTEIGYSAFDGCDSLTSIEIPSSVTSIGGAAFSGCKGLKDIKIPSSVTSIGYGAFGECIGLTSIEIPSSVTSLAGSAFYDCSSLTSVDISKGITEIETNTFSGCSSLKSVKIPSSVTSIQSSAFEGCSGLTNVDIPFGVTSIEDCAFDGCSSLKSIKIPSSVTNLAGAVFARCSGVESIVVDPKNAVYNSNGNCNAIIETKTGTLIQGCKKTNITSSVKSLGYFSFGGCSGLTSIKIPSSVTSIGGSAFSDCSGLTSVEIPSSVTDIGYIAFNGCDKLRIIYGTSGSYAETFAKGNWYQFVDITVPTVTNVKATAAGKNKVKVTWDKISGATGYIVYARKNGTYAKLGVTAATSYTDTKALDNDYNFYFVYAYKKVAGDKIVTGKCQKYAYAKGTCMAVTNLKASSVKGGVKLTWTKSAGADGYIVYGKKTDFKYGYIGMTTKNTATSYTDTKANKGSYNFYWVFPFHYDKNGNRVIGPICGYVYGKAK